MKLKKSWGAAVLCLATLMATAHARNLFVIPNTSGALQTIPVISGETFTTVGTISGSNIANVVKAHSTAAGDKIYLITSTASPAVIEVGGSSLQVVKLFSFASAPVTSTMSPDGRYLIVLADAIHIIDTTTDTDKVAVFTPAFNVALADVAVSLDSTRAYVLTRNFNTNTSQISVFDLATGNPVSGVTPFPLQTASSTTMTVAPNGLLYATAPNAFYELDPVTLGLRATIPVVGTPGKPVFDEALRAVFPLLSSFTNQIVIANVPARITTTYGITGTAPSSIDQVVIGNSGHLYAYSAPEATLFDLTAGLPTQQGTPTLSSSPANFGGTSFQGLVRSVVTSSETPPRFLFFGTPASVYRLDLGQNALTGSPQPAPIAGATALSYGGQAFTGTPTRLLLYGSNEQAAVNTPFVPIVARAVDASGIPLNNVAVTFTASAGTLSAATVQTNAAGYATTILTAPATTGPISVTASAAGAAPANISVTAVGTTGGGGGGGNGLLTIASGNGQLIQAGGTSQPLVAQLKDTSGKPVAGSAITFTLTGDGNLVPTEGCSLLSQGTMSCTTDANGQAAVQWGLYSLPPLVALGQGQITASNGGSSVVFIESASQTISALTGQPVVQPSIVLQNLLTGNTQLSGNVGQTLQGAIQVGAVTGGDNPNQPIRGVGVVVTGDTSGSGPTVTCANADTSGAVLTDATGVASCDLLIGGRPGTTPLTVTVGGGRTIWSGQIILTAAATPRAATLSVISGNNQSGNLGTALPAPLVVRVLDQFGTPLPGQTVSFSVSNPSGVTLSANSAQTNSNGQASVTATLGTVPGPHTVTATVGGNLTATFTVTANATLGAVTVVSGGGQTATVGRAFTNPLVVKVTDTTGKALPNTSVSFAITSGSATLSANSAVTDANGNATVNVTAGQTAGPVVVTATSGNFSATFNLTVQPTLFIRSVVNGANFVPGLAPGAIATIVGTGIAGNVTGVVVPTNVVGPLPTTLGGVSVTINGIQAPMFSVSNINGAEQINVQVPFEVTPGQPAIVVVNTPAGTATLNNVSVQSVQPAIFENVDAASGNRYAVAQRLSDGAYVTPATPVTRGQRVRVYLTGLGQTNPTAVTNQGGIAGQRVLAPLIVGINNAGIPYEAAEYLPGSNGVYMVTFVVPVDAPTGPFVPLSFGAIAPDGSVQYSQGSTLSIQ